MQRRGTCVPPGLSKYSGAFGATNAGNSARTAAKSRAASRADDIALAPPLAWHARGAYASDLRLASRLGLAQQLAEPTRDHGVTQLGKRLVLDLADALATHPQPLGHLSQGMRVAAIQAAAQLKHQPLAQVQRP